MTSESSIAVFFPGQGSQSVGMLGVHQSAKDFALLYERGGHAVQFAIIRAVKRIGLTKPFNEILIRAIRSEHPPIRDFAARMV